MSQEISEQDAQEIIRQFNESKANMHTFFTNVVKSKDTLKTGNLTMEELGMGSLPVRTYQELALFSKEICNQEEWSDYFLKLSGIQTDSSLSKEGFMLNLAVTQKKELADTTPQVQRKQNSGWFKKKDDNQPTT